MTAPPPEGGFVDSILMIAVIRACLAFSSVATSSTTGRAQVVTMGLNNPGILLGVCKVEAVTGRAGTDL
jgi:hypothetical protein